MFWLIALFNIAMYALEPRVSGAEKATPAEQRAERCQVLMRALDVVAYQRHRLDLAQGKEDAPPCERPGQLP